MDDVIYRQDAIRVIKGMRAEMLDDNAEVLIYRDGACGRLRTLPPAAPKRKREKWIYVERKEPQYDIAGVRTWAVVYKCSGCGFLHSVIENSGIYDFCPNCGAEMTEGEKG